MEDQCISYLLALTKADASAAHEYAKLLVEIPETVETRSKYISGLFPGTDFVDHFQMGLLRDRCEKITDKGDNMINYIWENASPRYKACLAAYIIAGYVGRDTDVETWIMLKLVPLFEPLDTYRLPRNVQEIKELPIYAKTMDDLFYTLRARATGQLPAAIMDAAEPIINQALLAHYKWAILALAELPSAEEAVVKSLIEELEEASDGRCTFANLESAADSAIRHLKFKNERQARRRDKSPVRVTVN